MNNPPDYILRTFKSTFNQYIRDPLNKMIIPSIVKPIHPRDCHYCGGLGTLSVFLVTDGPYLYPPVGTYKVFDSSGGEHAISFPAKWLDGHWYAGKNVEERCPACHGLGINPDYIEPPIRKHDVDISGIVKETPKVEVEEMDYSDH